jgi:heme A synthase
VTGEIISPDGPATRASRLGGIGQWLVSLVRSLLAPTPLAMRRIALAGLVASAVIILTGAAVRLSQSGLGCPDWPACTAHSAVAAGVTGDPLIHRWIEFGNRLVTVAIFIIAVLISVAAWQFKPGGRRRRDLVWLAAAQPGAILAQAIIGGIVVKTNLNPGVVSVHFLASSALVIATVALYIRCQEADVPARPLVRREVRLLALGMVCAVGVMLAAGTVVTGTGPLAGGDMPGGGPVPRYHLPLTGVTQFHADIGWLLGGLTVALVVALRIADAPARARRLGWLLAMLIASQGAIGYIQYFNHLPAGLVWVHVAGSVAIWITALLIPYTLRDRGDIMAGPAAERIQEPVRS